MMFDPPDNVLADLGDGWWICTADREPDKFQFVSTRNGYQYVMSHAFDRATAWRMKDGLGSILHELPEEP